MKNQNYTDNREAYYDESEGNAFVPSLSYDQLLMPAIRSDTSPRALKALTAEQEFHLTVEQNRAILAYTALNLTAQLSSMESALVQNCPTAESRLRGIVDAFAYAQKIKIVRY